MSSRPIPKTALCTYDEKSIHVRGMDLCDDLIGQINFTQMMFLDVFGRLPTAVEQRVLDAMMVTLMEHGLTPSAVSTRMTFSSAPEAVQGAIAAGILGAGSVMLGTLGNSAQLLNEIVGARGDIKLVALEKARWYKNNKARVPGFGHPHHRPDDPRTIRLFELADELGLPGAHVEACRALGAAVDKVYGKHLTINASAAMGALMCEINMPVQLIQGFAVVSRAAGLVAHIYEEMSDPAAWIMSTASSQAVKYAPP